MLLLTLLAPHKDDINSCTPQCIFIPYALFYILKHRKYNHSQPMFFPIHSASCIPTQGFPKFYLTFLFFSFFLNIIKKSWRLPPVLAKTVFCLSICMICKKIVVNLSVYSSCPTYNSSISSLSSVKLNSFITGLQKYCCFNQITTNLGKIIHRYARSKEKSCDLLASLIPVGCFTTSKDRSVWGKLEECKNPIKIRFYDFSHPFK